MRIQILIVMRSLLFCSRCLDYSYLIVEKAHSEWFSGKLKKISIKMYEMAPSDSYSDLYKNIFILVCCHVVFNLKSIVLIFIKLTKEA